MDYSSGKTNIANNLSDNLIQSFLYEIMLKWSKT